MESWKQLVNRGFKISRDRDLNVFFVTILCGGGGGDCDGGDSGSGCGGETLKVMWCMKNSLHSTQFWIFPYWVY